MELGVPIKGLNTAAPLDKMPPLTTQDSNNIRPIDVLAKKLRLCQRPAQRKLYTQQIGGSDIRPVVAICTVVTVDSN